MEIALAALVGAVVSALMALYYNNTVQQRQFRSVTTIDTISWADDIYDRLMTIHAQRDATFTGAPFGLSNEEYRAVVKEAKAMLLASKTRAKVALVYGEGPELMKFDALHNEFVEITETLLKADRENWTEINSKISDRFSSVVEPLIKSVESILISGARFPKVNRALFAAPRAPTVYLPQQEKDPKDIEMLKSGTGPAGRVKNIATWNLRKFFETIYDAARLVLLLSLVGFGAWVYFGKPDMAWLFEKIPQVQPGQIQAAPAPILPELCVEQPRNFGLDAYTGTAPIPNGTVLKFQSQEAVIKLAIKNPRTTGLSNVVFMLSLPKDITTVADAAWKPSWEELNTRAGSWLLINLKDDIKAGESQTIIPYPMVRFPAPGEYIILYKYFADNLQPQSGYFVMKFAE